MQSFFLSFLLPIIILPSFFLYLSNRLFIYPSIQHFLHLSNHLFVHLYSKLSIYSYILAPILAPIIRLSVSKYFPCLHESVQSYIYPCTLPCIPFLRSKISSHTGVCSCWCNEGLARNLPVLEHLWILPPPPPPPLTLRSRARAWCCHVRLPLGSTPFLWVHWKTWQKLSKKIADVHFFLLGCILFLQLSSSRLGSAGECFVYCLSRLFNLVCLY